MQRNLKAETYFANGGNSGFWEKDEHEWIHEQIINHVHEIT